MSNIRLQNTEVKNTTSDGLLIEGVGHEFLNINVHHCGTHGLYLEGSNCLIQNSQFNDNGMWGGHNYNGFAGERASNNKWLNNKYLRNKKGYGLILSSGSGNIADGGEAFGNYYGGIQVAYNSPSNNVVRNIKTESISVESGSSGTLVENNCVDPAKITNQGTGTTLKNNSPTACGSSSSPPTPTNVDVTQTQPPVSQSPSTSQPSGPSTSQVAMPFLIAGVIGAALLLGSD